MKIIRKKSKLNNSKKYKKLLTRHLRKSVKNIQGGGILNIAVNNTVGTVGTVGTAGILGTAETAGILGTVGTAGILDTLGTAGTLATELITLEDRETATLKFKAYIEGVKNNTTREQRYDIHVLTSIMSIMHDYNDPVIYNYKQSETTNTLIKIDANKDIKCCDETDPTRLKFFMEDIYTEDLDKFIEEYDNFIKTKQSSFFYKSNVANIAMLFKCYYKRCFDEYIKKKLINDKLIDLRTKRYGWRYLSNKNGFKNNNTNINNNEKKEINTSLEKNIWESFVLIKKDLLTTMITAYNTCSYKDICSLYIKYLEFYSSTVGIFLNTVIKLFPNFFLNSKKELSESKFINVANKNTKITKRARDKMYSNIIETIKQSQIQLKDTFFIYLSCSHVSEYKQARFYMTRFIDSYIGNGYVHIDVVLNTMDVIGHDFYFHGNLNRIKSTTVKDYDNINKKFIMELYKETKDIYQYGMYVLQMIQNEYAKYNPIVFNISNKLDIANIIKKYQFTTPDKSSDLNDDNEEPYPIFIIKNNIDKIINFLNWVLPENKYKYNKNKYKDNTFSYITIEPISSPSIA